MAKEYTVGGDGLAVAQTSGILSMVVINPSSSISPPVVMLRMWVSQAGSNTGVQQRVQIVTQPTSFQTLTAATPRHLKKGDTTASLLVGMTSGAPGSVGINASVEGSGAKTVTWGDAFNTLNGFLWVATPAERFELISADANNFALFLPTAVTSTSAWACGVNYSEGY